jgi:hypothetical protein
MRFEPYDVAVPTSVAVGASQKCADLRDKFVQLKGTFTATVEWQVSMDGTTWANSSARAETTPGFVSIPETCAFIRANVTAFTSGTPTAILGGFSVRGD